jgi:hypothetical protein
MGWKEIDARYVRQGELLLDLEFVKGWNREVGDMNDGKEGRPFRYPESFITFVGIMQTVFHLPNRQTEGFFKALSKFVDIDGPDHTTIGRRVSKLDLGLDEQLIESNDAVTIAVDSSGVKVTNRGDWVRKKHGLERRGWVKLHVAVNTRSGQVLSMEVTEEDVHDTRMMKPLVKEALKVAPVEKALGDGAYDSRANFQFLFDNGVEPVIKVRKNSVPKAKGCYVRKYAVQEQLQDLEGWGKRHGYGNRWMAESAFSSIKGRLGEYVRAKKIQNTIQEVKLKVFTYNWLIKGTPMTAGTR